MTPLHPETVTAINAVFAPAAQVVVALAFLVMIGAWGYRFKLWLKDRREGREPSEFEHYWPQEKRK